MICSRNTLVTNGAAIVAMLGAGLAGCGTTQDAVLPPSSAFLRAQAVSAPPLASRLKVEPLAEIPESVGFALRSIPSARGGWLIFGRKGWCELGEDWQVKHSQSWPKEIAAQAASCDKFEPSVDGRWLLVPSRSRSLCIDLATGEIKWSLRDLMTFDPVSGPDAFATRSPATGTPVLIVNQMFVGIRAIDVEGRTLWTDESDDHSFGNVCVWDDRVAYGRGGELIVRSADGRVIVRDRKPASAIWVVTCWPMRNCHDDSPSQLALEVTTRSGKPWKGIVRISADGGEIRARGVDEPDTWVERSGAFLLKLKGEHVAIYASSVQEMKGQPGGWGGGTVKYAAVLNTHCEPTGQITLGRVHDWPGVGGQVVTSNEGEGSAVLMMGDRLVRLTLK